MNHDVEPELDGQIELLLEQARLFRFVSAVADLRFDFFIRFTSQSSHHLDLVFLSHLFTCQMVIVQAGLANCYYARMFREVAQRRNHIVLRLLRLTGMNTNGRVNRRISFGELNRTPAAVDWRADGNNASYVSFLSSTEHVLEII